MSSQNILATLASKANMQPEVFKSTLMATVMPSKDGVSEEQFTAFLMVANKYNLNPITREIYAFPSRGGGIQPIVSIDGWMKIINSHPQFNGMEFKDNLHDGQVISITARIFRKDRDHPTEVTEYLSECRKATDTWKQWPLRMLRHKSAIQAARYAFGFSDIVDPDEAERIMESTNNVPSLQRAEQSKYYPVDDFNKNIARWIAGVQAGKLTAEEVIEKASSKGELTEEMKEVIRSAN